MHSSDGRSISHPIPSDRQQEFVAVLEGVLPDVAARLEALALYVMLAAFWGVVLYVALATFVQQ